MKMENLLCKGKDKDDGKWYEGYYMLMHDTTYCCMPSDNAGKAKRLEEENTHHYIIFECMTDWGLPNKHLRAEILPETLCRCFEWEKGTIWENDIYQWLNSAYGRCTGIVRFGEYWQDGSADEYPRIHCYGVYVEILKVIPFPESCISEEDYPDYLKTISVLEMFEENKEVNLIGNNFDNPELVEV